jgi:hypothetical protein
MKTLIASATLAMALLGAGAASAQTPTEEVSLPLIEGVQFDDTCGPKPEFQGRATCVRGSLASIGPTAEAYIGHFERQGWSVVGGSANSVIFARRRADGACDGLEMAAFYDETRQPSPGADGWLAFAPIPGNVCGAAQ